MKCRLFDSLALYIANCLLYAFVRTYYIIHGVRMSSIRLKAPAHFNFSKVKT